MPYWNFILVLICLLIYGTISRYYSHKEFMNKLEAEKRQQELFYKPSELDEIIRALPEGSTIVITKKGN